MKINQHCTNRSRSRSSTLAWFVFAAALVPGAAWGALPCEADIQKFCASVPIGGGRIQACLRKHAKELSPACASRYQNLEQEMGTLAAICRFDISRFCSDVSPGGGRVADCLKANQDDLSPECKDGLRRASRPAPK